MPTVSNPYYIGADRLADSETRPFLTKDYDLYIDKALGNDSNDGSEQAPWKTLTKYMDFIKSHDGNNFYADCYVSNGDYQDEPDLEFGGWTSTYNSVGVYGTSIGGTKIPDVYTFNNSRNVFVQDATTDMVNAQGGSVLQASVIAAKIWQAQGGGKLYASNPTVIGTTGNQWTFIASDEGAYVLISNVLTISGTHSTLGGFLHVNGGRIDLVNFSVIGSATGPRYNVYSNGILNLNGIVPSTIPGSTYYGTQQQSKIGAMIQGLPGTTQTVAQLPTANAAHKGFRTLVTDASAPTFGATVAGGGAVTIPVFCDGTNWKVG